MLLGVVTETSAWALVGFAYVIPAAPAVRAVLGGARGRALVPVLQDTGTAELVYAVGIFLGLVTV